MKTGYLKKDRMERYNSKRGWFVVAWRIVDGYGAAWNECDGVDSTGLEDPVLNADFAIYAEAHDTSGLQVGLKTGPMFGCVQFQRKGY